MRKIGSDKHGISTMIEYILLIVIVITMSGIIYSWMKTYVPKEDIECKDGVSVYISNIKCSQENGKYILNLTIKNSGRFNIRGFFIRGTDKENQGIANVDLSSAFSGWKLNSEIILVGEGTENQFEPTKEKQFLFSLDKKIYSVDLIPTRLEEIDGVTKFALCGNEKVSEKVNCD